MITTLEFKKAKSSALRRETLNPATGKVRQQGGPLWWILEAAYRTPGAPPRAASMTRLVDSDSTGVSTACWQWEGGKHQIRIGNKLDEAFFASTSLPSPKTVQLVKSAIAHEVCHAAYTGRDRADIDRRLRDNGLKFRFHNLAEDCRIEWKYLKERGKAHRFGWTRLNELPGMTAPTNKASTYLWQIKSREPALFSTIAAAAAPLKWTGLDKFLTGVLAGQRVEKVIRDFYKRFVEAPDEAALIPIERDWVAIFGHDVETVTGVSDFDESGGLPAAAGGAAASSSAPPAPSISRAGEKGGAPSETPVVQGDFFFPGDVPLDVSTRFSGLAPLSEFM